MQPSSSLTILAAVLALMGLALAGFGAFLLLAGAALPGAAALAVGLLALAAAVGLRRRRRWSAVVLGLLGLAGAVNTTAGGLLALAQRVTLGAVLQTLLGLLAAAVFSLLAIGLWRSLGPPRR